MSGKGFLIHVVYLLFNFMVIVNKIKNNGVMYRSTFLLKINVVSVHSACD